MISENLKRLAADSNVILSAVIGKAALRVFTHPEIELITTQYNLAEVEEYLPQLASRYGFNERLLTWQLKMLPLCYFSEKYYRNRLPKARKWMKFRDLDDAHLIALALKERVSIWSNDRDFEGISISVYTTAQLLKMLDEETKKKD
jgi:predicted nucleic acid-binding protein